MINLQHEDQELSSYPGISWKQYIEKGCSQGRPLYTQQTAQMIFWSCDPQGV